MLGYRTQFFATAVLVGVATAAVITFAVAKPPPQNTGVGNSTPRPPHPPRYTLVDLGTLGGEQSRALAMNDHGTVVGWSDPGPVERPFEPARQAFMRRLGEPMAALPALSWGDAEARDLNYFEQIVGVYTVDGERHGIYWNEGVPYDLNDITNIIEFRKARRGWEERHYVPLRLVIEANAINDMGQIVGCGLFRGDDSVHGLLLTPREPYDPADPFYDWADLGALPDASECFPFDVNELSEAVGVSGDDAFIWGGTISGLDDLDLMSEARALNDWGTAVGWTATDPARPVAAMWEGGHRFDLVSGGGPIGRANAIAENGYVVGWTATLPLYGDPPRYAMLWEGCHPVSLNETTSFPEDEAWWLQEATAVDATGHVAGYGLDPEGFERAFLLIPSE